MDMGKIIKELRIQKGWTMEKLADTLGVGKSAVNKWEKGYVTNIKQSTIKKMADIFGVSPAYIMGFDESKEIIEIDLTDEEYNLIQHYRKSDEADREAVKRLLAYASLMRDKK